MESAWRVQSIRLKRIPRMFSSQRGPSLVVHWNAELTCSLISFMYWTAVVWSTTRLAPSVSGPQAQILRAAFSSQSNFSRKSLARSLGSALGPAGPSSMALLSSSSMGSATMYKRLCLLGDLERQDWIRHDEVALSILFTKILQANLNVELTAACNDVLTTLLSGAHNQRVRLGELLQAFDELWQVLAILWLHSHLHDRGDTVLHCCDVVCVVNGGQGSRLEDELVNTHKCNGVTARHIRNLLNCASHHEHGTLDVLHVQVLLAARLVVRALNAHLLASGNGSAEHTAECVEAALVTGWHHLGHVHHQRTVRLAVHDGLGCLIIGRTLVQIVHTVLLGNLRRRQAKDNHGQERVSSVDPDLHRTLHERLALKTLLVTLESDSKSAHHFLVLGLVVVHDGGHELIDRGHDELAEGTRELLAILVANVGPDLLLSVKVGITPQALHHLVLVHAHLGCVDSGKTL